MLGRTFHPQVSWSQTFWSPSVSSWDTLHHHHSPPHPGIFTCSDIPKGFFTIPLERFITLVFLEFPCEVVLLNFQWSCQVLVLSRCSADGATLFSRCSPDWFLQCCPHVLLRMPPSVTLKNSRLSPVFVSQRFSLRVPEVHNVLLCLLTFWRSTLVNGSADITVPSCSPQRSSQWLPFSSLMFSLLSNKWIWMICSDVHLPASSQYWWPTDWSL